MEKQPRPSIRILIVDDHPVVRAGLGSMLGTQPSLEIAASASNGEEALAIVDRESVDVILLDLRMPGMSGLDTLTALKKKPQSPPVIILTSYELDEDVYRAIQAGAQGYLLKDTSQREIVAAIETVHAGKRYLPPHIAARLADRISRSNLTAREVEILGVLARGLTNKEIGQVFSISENTVRNHVNSIIEKLEVTDRTEAATTALLRGIIHIDH
ncbi:MAG TPA: response regulator transcription factor [Alloacidobacterium sp.]|nr:response regulator transcription factor [Alloacidobacterium sp.]